MEDEDYQVETADSAENLISRLQKGDARIDAILLDVWLPGMDGVEALGAIREMGITIPIIVISGHATLDFAVKATRLGAYDFLEKPLNLDRVVLTLGNALKQSHLEKRQQQLEAQMPVVEMLGSGIRELREDIEMAAPTPGRVLILGESGSGKEVAARLLHQLSDRASGPFVEMNCAAIPEELIESELFGHMKGSFTGAHESRQGKFELADGGTLFLDEIADMSLNTQAKVLRVLQEQRFQPVGSGKTIHVDVRVVAATNKALDEEIKEGRFREDLYFRLNVIPLRVPPLRERAGDIPVLCDHFVKHFARAYGKQPISFTEDAMRCLQKYNWPGNVRELRNIVERLMIMSRTRALDEAGLPAQIRGGTENNLFLGDFGSLKEAREHFEKHYIKHHLELNGGNITKTAEVLKMERSNLHKKIKAYTIDTHS